MQLSGGGVMSGGTAVLPSFLRFVACVAMCDV